MTYIKWGVGCLAWLWMGIVASAQPVLITDEGWPASRHLMRRSLVQRAAGPDTLGFSVNQPFFDDFSQATLRPDSGRWYAPADGLEQPFITRQMPVDPPSLGVATFDGLRGNGRPYVSGAIVSGEADRLLSHCLDLSALQPSDSVMLTFYLQAQGRGERPEASDSFLMYVRTNLPPPNEYRKVFARGGRSQAPFEAVVIPLEDPAYFHAGFQLRFESIGSLNGALDHWHLDYVSLAPQRRRSEAPSPDDQSITQLNASILSS